MPDDLTARCRAVLLERCHVERSWGGDLPGDTVEHVWVDVNDAAACMAEREGRLLEQLARIMSLRVAARGEEEPHE